MIYDAGYSNYYSKPILDIKIGTLESCFGVAWGHPRILGKVMVARVIISIEIYPLPNMFIRFIMWADTPI